MLMFVIGVVVGALAMFIVMTSWDFRDYTAGESWDNEE